VQTALQKLKPELWKGFDFKDEYITQHSRYADYEPESHVDWLPEYRSMARATSEDKGQERSKWNWLVDIEENTEYSRSPRRAYANVGATQLPQHRFAIQTRRELKRSRDETELDDEIHQTTAGDGGHQHKKKHVG